MQVRLSGRQPSFVVTPAPADEAAVARINLRLPDQLKAITLAARDSATMLRRSIKHIRRYPEMTLMLAGMPVVFLLLFVYVFGGTLGAGLGGAGAGRAEYLAYAAVDGGTAATAVAWSLGIALVGYVWAKRRTTAPDRAAVTRWCGPRDDAR